jgi:tetrapyrrole methylase family protein/MazG family protein
MTITIVGLGPGDALQITREAWQVLARAGEVYLRTKHHPAVKDLPDHLALPTFDHFYQQAQSFDEVYDGIAAEVIRLGQRPQGVVYAVPGHPLVGESTVTRILKLAEQAGLAVRIVNGVSFIAPILTSLGIDALSGLQIADATDIAAQYHPQLNPAVPAIIGQLYSREVASGVKLTLMNQYPDDHPVKLMHAVGADQERVETLPLYELDRRDDVSHLTSLYIPPLAHPGAFEAFQDTIAHLRAPDGCPWDREQTHQSLRRNLLEEAYEVLEALDADDAEALREELGDLLLQIVLHSQIAVEEGEFSMSDVIASIDAKIKRRHPHVFGGVQVSGVGDVIANWEAIKRGERADNGNGRKSALDGVPRDLPALTQAEAYSDRAARVGFDWPDVDGVLTKVAEEAREVQSAARPEERAEELGDLLFALVNAARWMKIDPEAALRAANAKFAARFRQVEAQAKAQSRDLAGMSLADLDALWERAKQSGR